MQFFRKLGQIDTNQNESVILTFGNCSKVCIIYRAAITNDFYKTCGFLDNLSILLQKKIIIKIFFVGILKKTPQKIYDL